MQEGQHVSFIIGAQRSTVRWHPAPALVDLRHHVRIVHRLTVFKRLTFENTLQCWPDTTLVTRNVVACGTHVALVNFLALCRVARSAGHQIICRADSYQAHKGKRSENSRHSSNHHGSPVIRLQNSVSVTTLLFPILLASNRGPTTYEKTLMIRFFHLRCRPLTRIPHRNRY